MVEISTNAICFEGICRVYRNAVVNHICVTLSAKYPDDWQERVRKSFKKEWETIRKNAESARNKGLVSEPLKDPEGLLGVNHFEILFRDHFDDLFPNLGDMPESDRRDLWRKVQSRAHEIKEVRDPALGHPAEADMTPQEGADLLSNAEYILRLINKDAAQKVNDLWQTVVGPNKTIQPTVVEPNETTQRLPCPYFPKREEMVTVPFVGREDELKWLRDWLGGQDLYHCRVLVGDGGKGKSAIAYEFAREVSRKRPEGLEIVIWLSAKKVQFQGGAAEDKDSDFWDLDSAVNGILKAYQKIGGPNGYEAMEPTKKSAECLQWLEAYPALIVLDDFDSLQKRGGSGGTLRETRNFFDKVLPRKDTKSRVLLTSRVQIPGLEDDMERVVAGFNREDGEKFIQGVIDKFKMETWFQPTDRANILRACDGSPLYIEELLRQCKTRKEVGRSKEEVLEVIKTWAKDGGERARRYALEEELTSFLSMDARNALLACALFNGDIPRAQLKAILGFDLEFDDERLDDAVGELRGLFLIEASSQDVTGRITMNSNTMVLVISVAREVGPDNVNRIEGRLKALYGEDNQGDSPHRPEVRVAIQQALAASRGGRHDKAINLLKEAIALCEGDQESDKGSLGDLYGLLAKAYDNLKDVTSARQGYKQAAAFRCSKPRTYKNWYHMEKGAEEWTYAIEAAVTGLEILRKTGASPEDLATLHYMAAEAREGKARDLASPGEADKEKRRAAGHRRRAGGYRREAEVRKDRARRDDLNS